jgi:hypothetical protein
MKNVEFLRIESLLESVGLKQMGVEAIPDSELGFRMWGGKDTLGVVTRFLAKNKPGLLYSLRLSSLSGSGTLIAKIDANGNIVRGTLTASDFPVHNDLNSLQGGNSTERYHITLVEKNNLHAPLTLASSAGPLALDAQEISFLFGSSLYVVDGALQVNTTNLDHGALSGLTDDDHTQYVPINATRGFSAPVVGKFPTIGSHLATRDYVDAITSGVTDFQNSVKNFSDAIPTDPVIGDRYIIDDADAWAPHDLQAIVQFDGTDWIDKWLPTQTGAVGARTFVEEENADYRFTGTVWQKVPQVTLHSELLNLQNDDHAQYSLVTGTRAYTAPVSGITPTIGSHLATKAYVDSLTYVLPEATTTTLGGVIVGAGLAVSSGTVSLETSGIVAGEYGMAVYDSYGRATSGVTVCDAAHGGTDQSTYIVGDILYASGTTTLSKFSPGTVAGNMRWSGSAWAIDTTAYLSTSVAASTYQPISSVLTSIAALSSGTGLLKLTAGVASLDTSTYLTANQTITLSGAVTGSGTTAITTAFQVSTSGGFLGHSGTTSSVLTMISSSTQYHVPVIGASSAVAWGYLTSSSFGSNVVAVANGGTGLSALGTLGVAALAYTSASSGFVKWSGSALSIDTSTYLTSVTGDTTSRTANTFYSAPNGSAGTATFRTIVLADISTALSTWTGSSTVTTLGTVTTGTWHGTLIGATYGGTGQSSYTVGDMLYASSTTALSKLTASTSGYILCTNGTGTAPSWKAQTTITSLGTITTGVWNGTAIGYGYGGTTLTGFTGAYYIPYSSSATALTMLAPGTAGYVLSTNSTTSAPSWISTASIVSSNIASYISGTTNYVPKFTSANVIGNSTISDSGSLVTISNALTVTGAGTFGVAKIGTWSQNTAFARFGHSSFDTSTGFGMLQQSDSTIYLESNTSVIIRYGGGNIASFTTGATTLSSTLAVSSKGTFATVATIGCAAYSSTVARFGHYSYDNATESTDYGFFQDGTLGNCFVRVPSSTGIVFKIGSTNALIIGSSGIDASGDIGAFSGYVGVLGLRACPTESTLSDSNSTYSLPLYRGYHYILTDSYGSGSPTVTLSSGNLYTGDIVWVTIKVASCGSLILSWTSPLGATTSKSLQTGYTHDFMVRKTASGFQVIGGNYS